MATEHSADDNREGADERAVRSFLENAAPIILESRTLDDSRFEAVQALALEFGLSDEQLACELQLLQQRGVISDAPWERLETSVDTSVRRLDSKTKRRPIPPSRASRPPSPDKPPAPPGTRSPASPSSPVKKAPPPKTSPTEEQELPSLPAERHDDATPTPTSAGPPPPPAPTPSPRTRFRELVAQRLRQKKPLTRKSQKRLQSEGAAMGLTPEDVATILGSLIKRDSPGAPPVAARQKTAPARSRPTDVSPSDRFRQWVTQKLAGYPSRVLALDDEQGLIGVGVHRHHLAKVLATHIVRDIATDREMRLERDLDDASCHATVAATSQSAENDDKLREFFEQVAPILTQHRGINAKSRVMMNAVAEKLGLSRDELDQAIAALQRVPEGPNENDPRQMERRDSFRSYLRRAIAQLPNGIVTFKTERRLFEAGEHFHGVVREWIKPTINEVAAEMGARFISQDQAIEHVSELVDDFLSQKPVIDNATRTRIYSEGTRWDLDPIDIEAILRDRTQRVKRQIAVDRQTKQWVLTIAISAAAVALVAFAWMLLSESDTAGQAGADRSLVAPTKIGLVSPSSPQKSWWSDALRIAAVKVRMARPQLKRMLDQINDGTPDERSLAYRQLIETYADDLGGLELQREMNRVLTESYALDPADSAVRKIPEALLRTALTLDTDLPATAQEVRATFWGCRTATRMLKHADLSPQRATELTSLLEAATHEVPDRFLDAEPLERQCCGAMAERFFRALIRSTEEAPDQVGDLYSTVAAEAETSLDADTLARLNADFLEKILPLVEDRWENYARAIRGAAMANEPTAVVKMLKLYQASSESTLKNFLTAQFFERLGAAPRSLTESEMIEALRESLGVAAEERYARRWTFLEHEAEKLLNRKRVSGTHPDVLLQEVIDLTHLSTLACALTRGEPGFATFDELRERGTVNLDIGRGPWSTDSRETFEAPYPASSNTLIQRYTNELAKSRNLQQQLQLLQMIARQAGRVSDINPHSGTQLAEYIVKFKRDEVAHREVVKQAKTLSNWNAVRLGLVDELEQLTGPTTQLQEFLSAALGDEVDLESQEGRARIQRRFLQQVIAELSDSPASDNQSLQTFDTGSKAILDLYITQAKLLDLPLEDYSAASQPSAVLVALVEHLSGQLEATKLTATEQALLTQMPYRLEAVDFVATNDIQYTALLEETWLQLLAMHISQRDPHQTVAAHEIASAAQPISPEDETVFDQLRELQSDILRVWLLLRPAKEDSALGAGPSDLLKVYRS
jgi:hypothetical protein